jgi:type II secretory pathway component PulM
VADEQSISLAAVSDSFPRVTQRTVELRQEDARTRIALLIVGAFAIIVVVAILAIWVPTARSVDEIVKIIQTVLSPLVGIVGAVTGFYFGARQGQPPSGNSPQP